MEKMVVRGRALTDLDRAILRFELSPAANSGRKSDAIRTQFGLTVTRYYQLLNALTDSPAALEFEPVLVRRLQRLREKRLAERG